MLSNFGEGIGPPYLLLKGPNCLPGYINIDKLFRDFVICHVKLCMYSKQFTEKKFKRRN